MESAFDERTIGGTISIDHLNLTSEQRQLIDDVISQAMAEEEQENGEFYDEEYKAPEWFGMQHGCKPKSYGIAGAEPIKEQERQKYPIVPKDDFQPEIRSKNFEK